MYYFNKFDDVISSGFWVIPKITSANICKSIHDIIDYFTSIYPFKFESCGKEAKKLQTFCISLEQKELFRWNKKHFSVFEAPSFGDKIKKIADTSFKFPEIRRKVWILSLTKCCEGFWRGIVKLCKKIYSKFII